MIPCLPIAVPELGELLLEQIAALNEKTRDLDKRLRDAAAGRDGATKHLQTMPGVGPVTRSGCRNVRATLMEMLAYWSGLCGWLELVPIQRSTGRQAAARKNLQDRPAGYPQALDLRRVSVTETAGRSAPPENSWLIHARPEAAPCWSRWRLLTRWRAGSGRCSRKGRELSGSGDDGSLIETITQSFVSGTPGV